MVREHNLPARRAAGVDVVGVAEGRSHHSSFLRRPDGAIRHGVAPAGGRRRARQPERAARRRRERRVRRPRCSGGDAAAGPSAWAPSMTPAVHAADFKPRRSDNRRRRQLHRRRHHHRRRRAPASTSRPPARPRQVRGAARALQPPSSLARRSRRRAAAEDARRAARARPRADRGGRRATWRTSSSRRRRRRRARARRPRRAERRPAKVPRAGVSTSSAGGGAAWLGGVSGLPRAAPGVSVGELQAHFAQVGPVVRVKVYKDGEGRPKGDALVVYEKEASVFGALQLLSGRELRVGVALAVERAVFADARRRARRRRVAATHHRLRQRRGGRGRSDRGRLQPLRRRRRADGASAAARASGRAR